MNAFAQTGSTKSLILMALFIAHHAMRHVLNVQEVYNQIVSPVQMVFTEKPLVQALVSVVVQT